MKKILTVLVLALMVSNMYALDLNEENSYFGFRLGTGLSYFTGSDWQDAIGPDSTMAATIPFSGGLYYNWGLTDVIGIESGMHFLYGGGGFTYNTGSASYTSTMSYTALEFPILAKYSLKSFDFFIGPEFILIVGDFNWDYAGGDTESVEPDSRFDMGIHMGGEYVFDSGLTLGLNYMPTFTGFGTDEKFQANVFRLTIGSHL